MFLANPVDKNNRYEPKPDIDRQVEKSMLNEKSETKGANFDPITIEAEPEDVLINLIASILNLKEGIAVDGSNKQVLLKAAKMKRASYINDLEYKLVLALNYPKFPVDVDSGYFATMLSYIEKFYE